ncbi:hypothetical protein WN51_02502 [Melipona quadrifasciata]|uniref:Uncharacterized protein n=1 Tax=Melipona quadrifasciata TaxID=166423 RepID=A0A0M8ZUT9_9HYME|nr:hypothetical protein WN51_02502 [Melipona quadrifasciata]
MTVTVSMNDRLRAACGDKLFMCSLLCNYVTLELLEYITSVVRILSPICQLNSFLKYESEVSFNINFNIDGQRVAFQPLGKL